MIVFLIVAVVLICLAEVPPLVKKKLWKELTTFGFIIGAAIFLGIVELLTSTTPVEWLEQLLIPVGEAMLKHN